MQWIVFKWLLLVLSAGLISSATATTWGQEEVEDPFIAGATCTVSSPASYGSYIYHWPSKYDQVFWPYTDGHGIWYCEQSGFISFMPDFATLKDADKAAIQSYLNQQVQATLNNQQRLERLEAINALRSFDQDHRNLLLRVYARWQQDLGDFAQARAYRKLAFQAIKRRLDGQLTEAQRLEYLYLAGVYAQYFSQPKASQQYIELLTQATKALSDEELAGYAEYLIALSAETRFITPQGKLDPELPQQE